MDMYHVINRGVEGRTLFMDKKDYSRFVHDLFEFNDTEPTPHNAAIRHIGGFVNPHIREKIVDIHGWCLMKNHYHLLLSERVEGGLSLFLRKLNVGYANYFNQRYERKGTLFQGRTKKILIKSDAHFLYILHYIHLNPLDYLPETKEWRERDMGTIKNSTHALEYLSQYKWSSYLDYSGTKNVPSILTTSLFSKVFTDYKKEIGTYLREREYGSLSSINLE